MLNDHQQLDSVQIQALGIQLRAQKTFSLTCWPDLNPGNRARGLGALNQTTEVLRITQN